MRRLFEGEDAATGFELKKVEPKNVERKREEVEIVNFQIWPSSLFRFTFFRSTFFRFTIFGSIRFFNQTNFRSDKPVVQFLGNVVVKTGFLLSIMDFDEFLEYEIFEPTRQLLPFKRRK